MADNIILWPSWRYGPDGQAQIFEGPEEVPSGWADHPNKVKAGPAHPAAMTAEQEDTFNDKVGDLVENNTQADLVSMLEKMKEVDEDLEFSPAWPKHRLAVTVLKNGGPLED